MAKKNTKKNTKKVTPKKNKAVCECASDFEVANFLGSLEAPDAPFGYEAYEVPVVEVGIDVDDKSLKTIEKNMKEGYFVSKNEYLRHVIREAIKNNLIDVPKKK
jgi:hypothetical protein